MPTREKYATMTKYKKGGAVDVEVPKPKPHVNPIKTAINKIPSKLEEVLKKGVIDPVVKAGKAYAEGKIPLTIPKTTKKKQALKNIKKAVKEATGKNKGGVVKPKGYSGGGEVKGGTSSQISGRHYKGVF
jgi:hypothetical protein